MKARQFPVKICIICLISILALLLFSIVFVSATGNVLLCLKKGQVAKFSLCNPTMADKYCTCTSTSCSCQLCVTENTPGIYCPASPNACNIGSLQCTYLPGTFNDTTNSSTNSTLPNFSITLVNPRDDYSTKTSGMTFSYTVKNSTGISSCSLYANGILVATNSTKIKEYPLINTIIKSFDAGNYSWSIKCVTNTGVSGDSVQRDLVILSSSSTNPQSNITITLTNPASSSSINVTNSGEVSFIYDLSDNSNISQCNLLFNNSVVAVNSSEIKNSQNNFSINLSEGNYSWNVNCIDKSAKIWQSEIRTLTIQNSPQVVNPPPVSGGGGDSGGGGGGGGGGGSSMCLTKWNCSEWSECNNNTQTRKCSYETGKCKPEVSKPIESQSCAETQGNESITNQTIPPKNSFNDLLTGAATALKNKPLTIVGSIVVIAICIALMFLIRRGDKKKRSEGKSAKKDEKKDEVKVEKEKKESKE